METIRRSLSCYRNELKGIAILWVVFFHAQLGLDGIWYQIQRIGYGGVDIFFFLSGFGLYHSLEKDADLGRYLRRRGERLLPAYLPFCLLWLAVMLPLHGAGLASSIRIALGNLTMSGYFAGAELNINWYVSGMALSLLLAPVFHAVLRAGKRFWLRASALIGFLFALGLGYVGNEQYMAISRLPVFALGMVFAAPRSEKISAKKAAFVLTAACIAGLAVLFVCLERYQEMLITYAMYWHPFVVIAPALCVGLSLLFSKVPDMVNKPFGWLGKASFEIFLFNVWAELLGKRFGLADTPMTWVFWSLASIAAGLAYHWVVGRFLLFCKQKLEKRG